MLSSADQFFSALLTSGDMSAYLKLGNIEQVFEHTPSESRNFEIIQEFIDEYGKMPELDTFNELTGKSLKKNKEDPRFFFEKLFKRHVKKSLLKSSSEAGEKLAEKDIDAAYEIIRDSVNSIEQYATASKIANFKYAHDILKQELIDKKQPDYGVTTGWETFDSMNGSLRGGDVVSICGRTGLGKSFIMMFIALHIWAVYKKPVLFFSPEMNTTVVFERLAAMVQGIPYNDVKQGDFSRWGKIDKRKEFFQNLLKIEESDLPDFNLVDGNMSTTLSEVVMLSKQLKPAAVFVDGAYMVKSDQGWAKHERIGNVANTLKKEVASDLNIPVFASWQFSREATKLKKGQKTGTEHIGGSDEIGNVSSIVLGLFEEESAETINKRKIQIVKGRSGEKGEFLIGWDFRNMQFTEIKNIPNYQMMKT